MFGPLSASKYMYREKDNNDTIAHCSLEDRNLLLLVVYDQLIQRVSSKKKKKKKDDITVSRLQPVASTVWENILIGCETSF